MRKAVVPARDHHHNRPIGSFVPTYVIAFPLLSVVGLEEPQLYLVTFFLLFDVVNQMVAKRKKTRLLHHRLQCDALRSRVPPRSAQFWFHLRVQGCARFTDIAHTGM